MLHLIISLLDLENQIHLVLINHVHVGRTPGAFYADPEAECQVFHRCVSVFGVFFKYSFLCPHGSIFNQEFNTCDWWYRVQCGQDISQDNNIEEESPTEEDSLDSIEDPIDEDDDEDRRNPIIIQSIFLDQDTFRDLASGQFGSQISNNINYNYQGRGIEQCSY